MKTQYRFPLMISCLLLVCGLTAGTARANLITYTAILNSAETIPPSGSSATGTATITINTELSTLEGISLHAEFSGLSSAQTSATLHSGTATSNGTQLRSVGTGSPLDTLLVFTLPQLASFSAALQGDSLYLNINTAGHPAGEIRGKFVLTSTVDDEDASWGAVKALYR